MEPFLPSLYSLQSRIGEHEMSRKPCKCCSDNKPNTIQSSNGHGYNRLTGDARAWAKSNSFAMSEHCVKVDGGRRFNGAGWQKSKCGDGSMGFSTRRKGQEDVRMETGMDGQLKKSRSTLVRPKSARATTCRRARRIDGSKCGLVNSDTIMESMRDPIVVSQQAKMCRKMKLSAKFRGVNRNKVRRMAKQNRKMQLKIAA